MFVRDELNKGIAKFFEKKYADAIIHLSQANKSCQGTDDKSLSYEIHYFMGAARYYRAEYQIAITYLQKVITEHLEKYRLNAYKLLAQCYEYLNDIIHAIEMLRHLLPLESDKSEKAEVSLKLGKFLVQQQKFAEGNEHLQEAQSLFKETKDDVGFALSFLELGISYELQRKYQLAVKEFTIAGNCFRLLNDQPRTADVANHLGFCKLQLKEYSEAKTYLQTAYDLYPEGPAKASTAFGLIKCAKNPTYDEKVNVFYKGLDSADQLNADRVAAYWEKGPAQAKRALFPTTDDNVIHRPAPAAGSKHY